MCDAVMPRLADIKGAYVEPLKEDNNLWYKLRSDRFDQFNAAENVELQRLILTEFLDEVLLMPSRF